MDRNASATLADLYDPDFMPPELRKAHRELDAAVDKLYNPRGFADERARVEHLFRLYERLVDPLTGDGARQNARGAQGCPRLAHQILINRFAASPNRSPLATSRARFVASALPRLNPSSIKAVQGTGGSHR